MYFSIILQFNIYFESSTPSLHSHKHLEFLVLLIFLAQKYFPTVKLIAYLL